MKFERLAILNCRRLAVVAVVISVAAAQAAVAQRAESLRSSVDSSISSEGLLVWSSDRPLARTDFRGTVPSDSPFGAGGITGMLHAIACDEQHFEFTVIAIITPADSWTKPDFMLDDQKGAYELAHEQAHFDLSEISARLLRAELVHFYVPCDSAESAFIAIADAAETRLQALQARYDDETDHSLKVDEQERWLSQIRAMLDTIPVGDPWTSTRYRKP